MGALLPSSKALARHMAGLSLAEGEGPVVELGAGTGVVTAALLDRGIAPSRLVAVERSPALAEILRSRFPGVRVVCGDACDLRRLLRRLSPEAPVGTIQIVSSLPLRSLPENTVRAILREIGALLRPGGTWIQYTYALAHRRVPPGFQRRESSFVWKNVPPARIDVFTAANGS
jgi:phosphatidylethanolamine/phosphatidyl-N-methylethanolamine N-methyltransferase